MAKALDFHGQPKTLYICPQSSFFFLHLLVSSLSVYVHKHQRDSPPIWCFVMVLRAKAHLTTQATCLQENYIYTLTIQFFLPCYEVPQHSCQSILYIFVLYISVGYDTQERAQTLEHALITDDGYMVSVYIICIFYRNTIFVHYIDSQWDTNEIKTISLYAEITLHLPSFLCRKPCRWKLCFKIIQTNSIYFGL